MQRQLLIIGLAAAASATLYLSLTTGVLGTPLFAYFVQLPVLFVGLSFGLAPAGLASFGSAGLVMAFGGGIAALVFIVIQVAPCLLTTRQALLSRVGQDGKTEWYPLGLVLCQLVLYAAIVMVLAHFWVRWNTGSIEAAFTAALTDVLGQFAGEAGQLAAIARQVADYAAIVPGIIAVSWVLMTVINAALAQLLALRGGQAQRPGAPLAELWLPAWCGPALAIGTLAALVAGGDLAFFAQGLAALLAVPFLMQGLAVVHSLAHRLPARGLALAGFYLVLILFSWPLVVVVVVLGLVEDWAHLRRRLA
ncbi:MAG: DUF2232 domain-containing protein [Geminicoccaceae bacterium]